MCAPSPLTPTFLAMKAFCQIREVEEGWWQGGWEVGEKIAKDGTPGRKEGIFREMEARQKNVISPSPILG